MNIFLKEAAEYTSERTRKGFEFEFEQSIWHVVLEVLPTRAAGFFGVSAIGGHVAVFGTMAVVALGVYGTRRYVVRHRTATNKELHEQAIPPSDYR